jgi:hypothetical protein
MPNSGAWGRVGNMNITITFTCPYCGCVGHEVIDQKSQYAQIHPIWCDAEEGGCGRLLAIEVELKPLGTVYEMKEVLS